MKSYNWSTFYAAGGRYASNTQFYSEPDCFEKRVEFSEVEGSGATKEEAALELLTRIKSRMEQVAEDEMTSIIGIELPETDGILFRAKAELLHKYVRQK